MKILQPSQLTELFSLDQELYLQDNLKTQFTGMVRPGFYTLVWESDGRATNYLVGFLVEVLSDGGVIVIECYAVEIEEMNREKFEQRVEKLSENAETSANTILARTLYKQKHADLVKQRNLMDKQRRKN